MNTPSFHYGEPPTHLVVYQTTHYLPTYSVLVLHTLEYCQSFWFYFFLFPSPLFFLLRTLLLPPSYLLWNYFPLRFLSYLPAVVVFDTPANVLHTVHLLPPIRPFSDCDRAPFPQALLERIKNWEQTERERGIAGLTIDSENKHSKFFLSRVFGTSTSFR